MKLKQIGVSFRAAPLYIGVVGIVGIFLAMLIAPNNSQIYAGDRDQLTMLTSASIAPTIAIAASPAINLNIIPKSTGSFSSGITALSVATNSSNGYSIYMSTNDGTQDLKFADASVDAKIGPVAADATSSDFAANTWGYSLDSAEEKTYQPVPATNTLIKSTTESTPHETYQLAFGTLVDTSLPAGEYYNTVTISAIANPNTFSNLNDIVYMQQMTSQICENTKSVGMQNPATKRLIDTRDGKSYWVAKLADERCWMTQNLALDITAKGLSVNDSNLESDWNQTSPYKPTTTITNNTVPSAAESENSTHSWNLGDLVLATPELITECDFNGLNIGSCDDMNIVDVSNKEKFKSNYVATKGSWKLTNDTTTSSTTVAVDCTEWDGGICTAGSYDAHYLLGNYYAWNAATAGTGSLVTTYGGSSDGSICPKGWTPADAGINIVPGTMAYLLQKYGLAVSADSGPVIGTGIDGKEYNITLGPLYMVKNGQINPSSAKLEYSGGAGFIQSRTIFRNESSTNYALSFNQVKTVPSNVALRHSASALRCVNDPEI